MRYDPKNILGKGGFSTVFSGFYFMSESSEPEVAVAVKRIERVHFDESAKDVVLKEADIMKKLGGHPNVLSFICTETSEDFL